jgi:hypothetical protein
MGPSGQISGGYLDCACPREFEKHLLKCVHVKKMDNKVAYCVTTVDDILL